MRQYILGVALSALLLNGPALGETYLGGDLSFANEMADCGVAYRDRGKAKSVYAVFKDRGATFVRIRLWTDGNRTGYSNLADVKRSLKQIKALHMKALLDFHYSDHWADSGKQIVPAAWREIADDQVLAKTLYRYTYDVLAELGRDGLMPDVVQPGNEINHEILRRERWKGEPINWRRNALLLNAAIAAVRDAGKASASVRPKIMVQIAQPENVPAWLDAAERSGVTDFDVVGISYYGKWSLYSMNGLGGTIRHIRNRLPGRDVVVVETAYPHALSGPLSDGSLAAQMVMAGYPPTAEGQRAYYIDLTQIVFANGGAGVIPWAPDWLPSHCRNGGPANEFETMAFFDNDGKVLPAVDFMQHTYARPVHVTFRFLGKPGADPPLFYGDFLGVDDFPAVPLKRAATGWVFETDLMPGTYVYFQVYGGPNHRQPLVSANTNEDGVVAWRVPGENAEHIMRLDAD